jgi:hypothetical protein
MTGQFIRITLSGSPEEIGLQHEKLLSEQIYRNIEFNKRITLSNLDDEAQVIQSAERIKEHIKAYNPNYITEIDHLALPAVLEGNAGPGVITAESLEPQLFFECMTEQDFFADQPENTTAPDCNMSQYPIKAINIIWGLY